MTILAIKNRNPDKSKSDAVSTPGKINIDEHAHQGGLNPLWHNMALHVHHPAKPSIQSKTDGAGKALDGSVRAPYERSFGQSFHDVTVHDGPHASAAAQASGARAFTSWQDVTFGQGRYGIGSFGGRFLLGHELAHVAQMRSASAPDLSRAPANSRDLPAEREADRMALSAVMGLGAVTAQRRMPFSAALYSMLSDSAERIMLGGGDKGQVFDFLRANCPVADADLDAVLPRLFAAGSDDLWLARSIAQHGPEPLWPTAAYDERRRRQRDHGWAAESGGIQGVLMTTAGGRNVDAYFFPGTSDERALIDTLRTSPVRPYYSVIVVPTLFPDNAATRTRERSTPTNRNFPDPGQSLTAATPTGSTTPRDSQGRDILPQNIALMRLIERFRPSRIASVHGSSRRSAAGIFSDRNTVSANARAQAASAGLAAPVAIAVLEASAVAGSQHDENLALDMARAMNTAGHGQAVRGNQLSGTPTAQWSGSVPGGTSFGGWGPRDVSEGRPTDRPSMTVLTVEVATNTRSTDFSGSAAAARRVELAAYRDVIQTIFLGPP
jgi:hypothetical protein